MARRWSVAWMILVIVALAASARIMPTAVAQTEKVLRMAYIDDILTLDPPRITKMADYPIAMNVFNGLVRYKSTSVELEPDLAQRWEISQDGLTYTFFLRRGVKFHRGFGEVTAHDVKFSFERVLDPALRSPYAADMGVVSGVDVVDDYTVRVRLREPKADFLTAVLAFRPGYVVSRKAVEQYGDRFGLNPVGTGPYMLERYAPRQEIVLVWHPEYFGWFTSGGRRKGGGPHIKRVIFRVIPDETVQVLALNRGDLDYAPIRTPGAYKLLLRDRSLAYTATPVLGRLSMWANTHRPVLDNAKLRQALSHAINRSEFIRTVGEGLGTERDIWSEIPEGVFGHISDAPAFPYNLQKARALLAEAGLDKGLRPLVAITRGGDKDFLEAIAGYWAKIGVTLRVDVLDPAALAARQSAGDFDFLISGPTRAAPDQFLARYLSSSQPNFYGRIDDLIHAQSREMNVEKRKQLLREIQVRLGQEIVAIPIHRQIYVTAFRKGVTGDVPNTFFWLFYWELMNVP